MAAKPATGNPNMSSNPRIAPKELIVTRQIAAQLRRQLRSGDRGMKRFTQQLKSPDRSKPLTVKITSPSSLRTYKNSAAKQKTSPKSQKPLAVNRTSLLKRPRKRKVTEKVQNNEYYPKKVKRKINSKTVTLKPKHELTKMHSLNKRKLTTPRKGINSPVPNPTKLSVPTLDPTPSTEPAPLGSQPTTVGELVSQWDDEDSLTHEDLIEILTCPSPVWWEDPPDVSFNEDPIPTNLLGKRMLSERKRLFDQSHMVKKTPTEMPRTEVPRESSENTMIMAQTAKSIEEKISPVDLKIELTKHDDKFIKKRSTLESILSCIKTKGTTNQTPPTKCSNTNEAGAQVSRPNNTSTKLDSIDQVLKDNSGMLKRSLLKHKPSILKTEPKRREELSDASADCNAQGSSNEDIFTDLRQDELLDELENLKIPIATTKSSGKGTTSTVNEPVQCIILDNDLPTFLDKPDTLPEDSMATTFVEGSDVMTFSEQYQRFVPPPTLSATKTTAWSRKEDKNKPKSNDTEAKAVPENMPPLKRYSKLVENKMASPGNSKFESGESDFENSSIISGQDADTISDTNVKYLNDDQISDYEGDRVKSKAEEDSGISVGEDNQTLSMNKEETSTVSMETDSTFILEEERSEHKNDDIVDENEDLKQKIETPDPEIESKKDCIIVYKIIETASEVNGDQPNDEFSLETKSRRVVKVKRSSNALNTNKNSRKSASTNPGVQSSYNNVNGLFKQYKKACLKGTNVKRTKCRIQKMNKAINRKGNVVSDIKKREGESSNKEVAEDKKSIAVTDTKTVNYCLKCSSIFETKACNYCVMKT